MCDAAKQKNDYNYLKMDIIKRKEQSRFEDIYTILYSSMHIDMSVNKVMQIFIIMILIIINLFNELRKAKAKHENSKK